MKNTKKIIAIIMMATVICSIFVACSRGNERENAVNNTVQESVENNTQDKEDIAVSNTEDKENSTSKVTDDATESASKFDEQKNEDQTVTNQQKETDKTTTKKVTTTAKKQETTTKKKVETTTNKKVETTTKKKVTTTKKTVTTTKKKVTTTKAAQKNVTPKEVQQKVNAYIKSKGATLDAVNAYGIHMTPDSASWSTRIDRSQVRLNNGRVLKDCKEWVDLEIAHGAKYLYCYYDSNWFYVLWLD